MSGYGGINARTTSMLQMNTLQYNLQRTQLELFRAQQQVMTNQKYASPSEGASSVSAIMQLKQTLQSREQWNLNLELASGVLDTTDSALGSISTTLGEAVSIASSQIGVGSDAGTRKDQAIVIEEKLSSILTTVNQQYNGISLFGGNNGAAKGGQVFVEFMGGVRYIGGDQNLQASVGAFHGQDYNTNGMEALGAVSARVESSKDLQVQLTSDTHLDNLAGASNEGVRKGIIAINVNGTAVQVDLSSATTAADVQTRINHAISQVNPAAGSISISGEGFALSANAGHSIAIQDVGTGKAASDLGIDIAATSSTVNGASTRPQLTELTPLAALGASIDFASGLQITQGEVTKNIDFSTANTIQDMINAVSDADLGIRMEINDAGNGLNIISEVSGLRMSVGENGGTTAHDLGISTLGDSTKLTSFREGLGVESKEIGRAHV